jgi:putative transposase
VLNRAKYCPKEQLVKHKKHTDEQKVAILKELDAGMPVKELTRKYGVSDATIYNWKKKFGGIDVNEVKRLRHLEDENRKLKRVVADLTLDNIALKDIVSGKL